jgi:hypothetical protein
LPIVFLILVFFSHAPTHVSGQATDSTANAPVKTHSIRRAALYSAVVPGLGQVYNRKAWKVPIIYAGFGVLGYFVLSNNSEYQVYKEAYVYTANGETYPIDNPYVGKYDESQLQRGMDFYRRNRDLTIIISSLWYVLNVLEAYVDAHFFDYDVSEDLTLRVSPSANMFVMDQPKPAPGLRITLNF